jgi:prevent-host-death family protein
VTAGQRDRAAIGTATALRPGVIAASWRGFDIAPSYPKTGCHFSGLHELGVIAPSCRKKRLPLFGMARGGAVIAHERTNRLSLRRMARWTGRDDAGDEVQAPLESQCLKATQSHGNLVKMTRIIKSRLTKQPKPQHRVRGGRRAGHWLLQDAKARFSELVRRVRSEGPQHVTVHGRDEVVVIAAEEFRRLKGDLTGDVLIAAMQASPHRDTDIEPRRAAMLVREVTL